MKNLPKARVARLAECRIEQKAGYNQHASPSQKTDALIPFFCRSEILGHDRISQHH